MRGEARRAFLTCIQYIARPPQKTDYRRMKTSGRFTDPPVFERHDHNVEVE
jgi:hypothetical protein